MHSQDGGEPVTSVIFVCNDEFESEKNLARLRSQVSHVQVVEKVKGVRQAYTQARDLAASDYFFIVDGDNEVFDSFNNKFISECELRPTIFWATNDFNISYGHGAIKLMHKEQFSSISNRPFVDLTENLFKNRYNVKEIVLSKHQLGSGFQRWRTIFRELTKLTLRRNRTLDSWLAFEENKNIHRSVIKFLQTATPREICTVLNTQERLLDLYQKQDSQQIQNNIQEVR